MGQINRREHDSGPSLHRVEPARLDSWKEIAAYLHRDARTVRRWERERKLPVHRVPGGERSGVFAYVSELDRWLRAPSPTPDLVADLSSVASSRVAPITVLRSSPLIEEHLDDSRALAEDEKSVEEWSGVSSAASDPDSESHQEEIDHWLPHPSPDGAATLSSTLPADAPEHGLPVLPSANLSDAAWQSGALPSDPTLWAGSRRVVYGITLSLALAVIIGIAFGYLHYKRFHQPGMAQNHPNAEAQDLYLRGRYFWNLRSEDDLNRAVDLFMQSIVTDPRYAAPYAGLADSYLLLRQYGHMSDAEAYPRALTAARQAVALDPSLPDAHRSLGFVLRFWNWDMPSAEREYLRAIELDPRNSQSHHWYATALLSSGRVPEAIAQIDIARALEPQSVSVLADRGLILTFSDAKLGVQVLEQITQRQPEIVSAHAYLSRAYLATGNYAGFLEEAKAAASLKREAAKVKIYDQAKKILISRGPAPMFHSLAHDLGDLTKLGQSPAYFTAQIYGLSGDTAQTMHFLGVARDQRDPGFLQVERDPAFKTLAHLPEFLALASQTGSQPAAGRQPIAHLSMPSSR